MMKLVPILLIFLKQFALELMKIPFNYFLIS